MVVFNGSIRPDTDPENGETIDLVSCFLGLQRPHFRAGTETEKLCCSDADDGGLCECILIDDVDDRFDGDLDSAAAPLGAGHTPRLCPRAASVIEEAEAHAEVFGKRSCSLELTMDVHRCLWTRHRIRDCCCACFETH